MTIILVNYLVLSTFAMVFCVCQRQHFTQRRWAFYPHAYSGISFWWKFGAEGTIQTTTQGETTALQAKFGKEILGAGDCRNLVLPMR